MREWRHRVIVIDETGEGQARNTFRCSFTTHMLAGAYDIRTVQALLGHKDAKIMMNYTHVLNQGPNGVRSPMDEVSAGSYSGQNKISPVKNKSTQGIGG